MIIRFLFFSILILFSANIFAQQDPQLQRQRVAEVFEEYLEEAPEDEEIQIRIRTAIESFEHADAEAKAEEIEALKRRLDESTSKLERATDNSPYRTGNLSLKEEIRNLIANQAILMGLTYTPRVLREAHHKTKERLETSRYTRDLVSIILGPAISLATTIFAYNSFDNPSLKIVLAIFGTLSSLRIFGVSGNFFQILLLDLELGMTSKEPILNLGESFSERAASITIFQEAIILSRISGALLYLYSLPANIIRFMFLNSISSREYRSRIKMIFKNISQENLFSKLRHPIRAFRERQRRLQISSQLEALVEFCKEKK